MVQHSPLHHLHARLDEMVGKVAQIDQDATDAAAAHQVDLDAAVQSVGNETLPTDSGS